MAWETREAKKAKDHERDRAKEKKRAEEQEREGRKLKVGSPPPLWEVVSVDTNCASGCTKV
jgi:hypothetical protein